MLVLLLKTLNHLLLLCQLLVTLFHLYHHHLLVMVIVLCCYLLVKDFLTLDSITVIPLPSKPTSIVLVDNMIDVFFISQQMDL